MKADARRGELGWGWGWVWGFYFPPRSAFTQFCLQTDCATAESGADDAAARWETGEDETAKQLYAEHRRKLKKAATKRHGRHHHNHHNHSPSSQRGHGGHHGARRASSPGSEDEGAVGSSHGHRRHRDREEHRAEVVVDVPAWPPTKPGHHSGKAPGAAAAAVSGDRSARGRKQPGLGAVSGGDITDGGAPARTKSKSVTGGGKSGHLGAESGGDITDGGGAPARTKSKSATGGGKSGNLGADSGGDATDGGGAVGELARAKSKRASALAPAGKSARHQIADAAPEAAPHSAGIASAADPSPQASPPGAAAAASLSRAKSGARRAFLGAGSGGAPPAAASAAEREPPLRLPSLEGDELKAVEESYESVVEDVGTLFTKRVVRCLREAATPGGAKAGASHGHRVGNLCVRFAALMSFFSTPQYRRWRSCSCTSVLLSCHGLSSCA